MAQRGPAIFHDLLIIGRANRNLALWRRIARLTRRRSCLACRASPQRHLASKAAGHHIENAAMERRPEARESDSFWIRGSSTPLAKALGARIDSQTKTVVLDLQANGQPSQVSRRRKVRSHLCPSPGQARHWSASPWTLLAPARARSNVGNLVPRRPFDKVIDENGVDRINTLSLGQGSAIGVEIAINLGASLALAIDLADTAGGATVREIAAALIIHIGIRYGSMSLPGLPAAGGLAPWQLQLATSAFGAHPGKPISLADIATSCGLTLNHFVRAFARSTGASPRSWLLQQRIDTAKDMILPGSLSLAEIALACGFSDQSHLTHTFPRVVGQTPGNWRKSQLQ